MFRKAGRQGDFAHDKSFSARAQGDGLFDFDGERGPARNRKLVERFQKRCADSLFDRRRRFIHRRHVLSVANI